MMNSIGMVVLYLVIGVVYVVTLSTVMVVFLDREYGSKIAKDAMSLVVFNRRNGSGLTNDDVEELVKEISKDPLQTARALFNIVTWPVSCTINIIRFYQCCREIAESLKQ